MKNSLSIVSSVDTEEMCRNIVSIISPENVEMLYSDKRDGKRYFLDITSNEPIPHSGIVDYISGWIINNYELRIMEELFDEFFNELESAERTGIILSAKEKISDSDRAYNRSLIGRKLSAYLYSEGVLSIDGFVRFRLNEYRRELEFLLIDAADEFFCVKEYDEFVGLMAEYVETQMPLIELIHIIPQGDGSFKLYDFRKLRIKIEYEGTLHGFTDDAMSEEDRLVGILLTLTPRRIIWHGVELSECRNLLMTLRQIFGKRFSICRGCELCGGNSGNN